MLGRKPTDDSVKLDEAAGRLLTSLADCSPTSPEYAITLRHLERVNDLRQSKTDKRRISPDVIATGVCGILQVLIIVAYEQKGVVASKAMTFIKK